MRYSQYFIPTVKETPADAEVVSHKLMLRAGMIRKLAAGIYNYLPLGLRSIRKVENIVREEMNRAGAIEVLMPGVLPAELWQESGRWDQYGKELLRFRDRKDAEFCLGPTHEEIVTDLVRREIKSYRQMPINLYQIQSKFRDEIRPRFGLMRGREFIMKDAYSFDVDEKAADSSYEKMYEPTAAYSIDAASISARLKPTQVQSAVHHPMNSWSWPIRARTPSYHAPAANMQPTLKKLNHVRSKQPNMRIPAPSNMSQLRKSGQLRKWPNFSGSMRLPWLKHLSCLRMMNQLSPLYGVITT
jgi:hypothetical protein